MTGPPSIATRRCWGSIREEVLAELGYSSAAIGEMIAAGVTRTASAAREATEAAE